MAIGFTPKYTTDLTLDDLTRQQFLVLALDIARQLGWKVLQTNEDGLIALSNAKTFQWKGKITIRIGDGLANIKSESVGSEMVDWGKNKKNVDRFTDLFYEMKYSFSREAASAQYAELQTTLTPPEQDVLVKPPPATRKKRADFLSMFIPKKGFFVTPLVIDINIAVFLIMVFSGANVFAPTSETLLRWGANFRPYTLNGEWWRLFTCCFLHIGIFHLLLNMYALLYIGLLLEPLLGRLRFATAYVLTGFVSSAASLYWHENTVSAGASGAIFGMYGVFLAMLTTNLIDKTARKALLSSIAIFVAFNLLYGLKSGIDSAAHLGGLLSGLLIGYIYYPSLKNPGNGRLNYSTLTASLLLAIVATVFLYRNSTSDLVVYQQKMESFASLEEAAISAYTAHKDGPREQLLSSIQDSGIYYWNENIKLLEGVQKLKIPEVLHTQATQLIDYCNARIDSYNYLYRKINDSTGSNPDSTDFYDSKITAIVDSLKTKLGP